MGKAMGGTCLGVGKKVNFGIIKLRYLIDIHVDM